MPNYPEIENRFTYHPTKDDQAWCNRAKNSDSVEDFLSHCRCVAESNAAIARNE